LLLGLRDGKGLEGVVGLEPHGEAGLLRSLAVRHDRRRSGLGSALVQELERVAGARGIRRLYLLTTTAEAFFAHRGYIREPREQAPEVIRRTPEFASLCPASAAFMGKSLQQEPT
jgi:amino-acid N-acetyltransferase